MHIISRKAILDFAKARPDSQEPLDRWYRKAKLSLWSDFADLKQDFPTADTYRTLTIFDIKGNAYRLIAEVNYPRGKVFIREILTHQEYDRGSWKARWA